MHNVSLVLRAKSAPTQQLRNLDGLLLGGARPRPSSWGPTSNVRLAASIASWLFIRIVLTLKELPHGKANSAIGINYNPVQTMNSSSDSRIGGPDSPVSIKREKKAEKGHAKA